MITEILHAAKFGNELSDPAKWKRGQKLTNKVILFIGAILAIVRIYYPELPVSDETLLSLGGVVAGILAIVNDVLTTATTKKLGK